MKITYSFLVELFAKTYLTYIFQDIFYDGHILSVNGDENVHLSLFSIGQTVLPVNHSVHMDAAALSPTLGESVVWDGYVTQASGLRIVYP